MSGTKETTVVFVRHGESLIHVGGNRFCGELDPALSPLGLEQAERAREPLERAAPHIDRVWVSPRLRTRQTAALVVPDREVAIVDELRELSFGQWEGMTKEEARAVTPAEYAAWDDDSYANRPPGGESGADARPRIDRVLEMLEEARGETVLLVSHTTLLRLFVAILLDTPPRLARHRFEIGFASIGRLDVLDRKGKLKAFNL